MIILSPPSTHFNTIKYQCSPSHGRDAYAVMIIIIANANVGEIICYKISLWKKKILKIENVSSRAKLIELTNREHGTESYSQRHR